MTEATLRTNLAASIEDTSTRTPLGKAENMLQSVLDALREGIDASVVKAAVDAVWTSVVVPYNVPWVPETVERLLEARALAMIHDAIDGFYED